MGIPPQNWGPFVWASIHLIALGAPQRFDGSNQAPYVQFFQNLPYILPCQKCKEHLIEHLKTHSVDTAVSGGRDTLFRWTVDLHNIVNRSLGKEEMTLEDALVFWQSVATSGTKSVSSNVATFQHKKESWISKVIWLMIVFVMGMMVGTLFRFL